MIGHYFSKTFYNSRNTFPISKLTCSRKAFVFLRAASHNYSVINCVSVFITYLQFTVDFLLAVLKYLTLYRTLHSISINAVLKSL